MAHLLSAFRYFPEAFRQHEAVGTRVFCCQTCFLGLELDSVVMWLRLVSAHIQFNSSLHSIVTALNPNVQGQGFSSYQQNMVSLNREGVVISTSMLILQDWIWSARDVHIASSECAADIREGGSCYALSREEDEICKIFESSKFEKQWVYWPSGLLRLGVTLKNDTSLEM